jgi:hypothetical protein
MGGWFDVGKDYIDLVTLGPDDVSLFMVNP